jgi:hypothetical protein
MLAISEQKLGKSTDLRTTLSTLPLLISQARHTPLLSGQTGLFFERIAEGSRADLREVVVAVRISSFR